MCADCGKRWAADVTARKAIFITGGASGIGRAIGELFDVFRARRINDEKQEVSRYRATLKRSLRDSHGTHCCKLLRNTLALKTLKCLCSLSTSSALNGN